LGTYSVNVSAVGRKAVWARLRENGAAFDTNLTSFECHGCRIVTFGVVNVSSAGNNRGMPRRGVREEGEKKMANSEELAILLSTAQ